MFFRTLLIATIVTLLGCRAGRFGEDETRTLGSAGKFAALDRKVFYCVNQSYQVDWLFATMTLELRGGTILRVRQVDGLPTFDDEDPAHAYKIDYEYALTDHRPNPPVSGHSVDAYRIFEGAPTVFSATTSSPDVIFDPARIPPSSLEKDAKARLAISENDVTGDNTMPFVIGLSMVRRPGRSSAYAAREYSLLCYRRTALVANQGELDRKAFDAVKSDDVETLKTVVSRGAFINGNHAGGSVWSTLLTSAIEFHHDNVAAWIVDQPGIDIMRHPEDIAYPGFGYNALEYAIFNKRIKIVEKILARLTPTDTNEAVRRKSDTVLSYGHFPLALALARSRWSGDGTVPIEASAKDVLSVLRRLLVSEARLDINFCNLSFINDHPSTSLVKVAEDYPNIALRAALKQMLVDAGARADGSCDKILPNRYSRPNFEFEVGWAEY